MGQPVVSRQYVNSVYFTWKFRPRHDGRMWTMFCYSTCNLSEKESDFFVPMEVLLCRVRSIYINSHILNVRKVHFEIRGLNIRLWRNTISFMIISAHMDTRYSQAVISEPLVTEFVICVLPACSINWWILQNVKTPSVCYCTSELFVLEL